MSVLVRAPELAPILATLDTVGVRRGPAVVHGLAPRLLVEDPTGWVPAERFADGSALPELIEAARVRWAAGPRRTPTVSRVARIGASSGARTRTDTSARLLSELLALSGQPDHGTRLR